LTSSVETQLLQSLYQNHKILDLRLKGNRFSENLFSKVSAHLLNNMNKASNYTKEKNSKLKRQVQQVSLVTDTVKSGAQFYCS
jgi:hypothetical protein